MTATRPTPLAGYRSRAVAALHGDHELIRRCCAAVERLVAGELDSASAASCRQGLLDFAWNFVENFHHRREDILIDFAIDRVLLSDAMADGLRGNASARAWAHLETMRQASKRGDQAARTEFDWGATAWASAMREEMAMEEELLLPILRDWCARFGDVEPLALLGSVVSDPAVIHALGEQLLLELESAAASPSESAIMTPAPASPV